MSNAWENFWIAFFIVAFVVGVGAVLFTSIKIMDAEYRANCDKISSLAHAQSHKYGATGCDLVINGKIVEVQ